MGVNSYISFLGLNPNEKNLDSSSLLFDSILNLKTVSSNFNCKNSNPLLMKRDVKCFFASCGISLHKIFHAPSFFSNFNSYNDYMKNVLSIDSFDLPLLFNQGNTEVCMLHTSSYSNFPLLFGNIKFVGNCTSFSHSSYVHELTHVQIESVKNSFENYSNSEVFPYFLQLVYCDLTDKNMSSDYLNQLIIELKNNIRDYQILSNNTDKNALQSIALKRGHSSSDELLKYCNKYIASSIEAIFMFDIYKKSNANDKRMMVREANLIFNGKKTIEQSLDDLQVSYKKHIC